MLASPSPSRPPNPRPEEAGFESMPTEGAGTTYPRGMDDLLNNYPVSVLGSLTVGKDLGCCHLLNSVMIIFSLLNADNKTNHTI